MIDFFFLVCVLKLHLLTVNYLFCFVASKGGTSEYNRLCGCVSNNVQAINKNGMLFRFILAFHQECST